VGLKTAAAFESVPNFSTADPELVGRLRDAAGGLCIDVHSDQAHGRTVLTLVAASLPELLDRLFRLTQLASTLIDLRAEKGVHPRVGAADVIPIVALGSAARAEAAAAARSLASRIWEDMGLPTFLYGGASLSSPPTRLADIRHHRAAPDFGGPELDPRAGAVCVGERPPLVAYNVTLPGLEAAVSARAVRALRRLPGVQALAFGEQLSMNLTELGAAGIVEARAVAASFATGPVLEELVGLCPAAQAISPAADGALLEGRIAGAAASRLLAPPHNSRRRREVAAALGAMSADLDAQRNGCETILALLAEHQGQDPYLEPDLALLSVAIEGLLLSLPPAAQGRLRARLQAVGRTS